MVTSRFQLGLIATLAVGLGFSLASSDAIGYPAGAAVSLGSNPVISVGGTISSTSVELFTAPVDQDVVVTGTWPRRAMSHNSQLYKLTSHPPPHPVSCKRFHFDDECP